MIKPPLANIRRGLRKLNRSFGVFDDQFWKTTGINYATSQLLFAIEETSEPVFARDLSQTLKIDKSGVSRMLGNLERQAFVKLETHNSDARAKSISITSKGKTLLKKLNDFGDRKIGEALRGLSDPELNNLETIFSKLERSL